MNTLFRKDEIVKLCTGKTVLHLGFVQHSHLYEKQISAEDWLHEKIHRVAKKVVGIDYLNDDVDRIKQIYGYECYFGDVTKLEDLDGQITDKFDVVVCGELIEHLDNPGLMLDGIKRFLREDSILIITTPNTWSGKWMKLIGKGVTEDIWMNEEHVSWYSFGTLKQLLERKGFEEVEYGFYYGENARDLYDKNVMGLVGKLKVLRRLVVKKLMREPQYAGLFFVAKRR